MGILSASGYVDVLSFWIEGDQSCVTVKLVCLSSFSIRFLPLWVALTGFAQSLKVFESLGKMG